MNTDKIVFFDTEVEFYDDKILDIGAIDANGNEFHSNSVENFMDFLLENDYVCGHNIIKYDLKYLKKRIAEYGIIADNKCRIIDTLYLSPLMFPKKPYHRLVKDDKLTTFERNNPLNDAKKTRDLFFDEIAAFNILDEPLRNIYCGLLSQHGEFSGFFHYIGYKKLQQNISKLIRETFDGKICTNAPVEELSEKYPVELCFALSQISVILYDSIAPPWVLKTYPAAERILYLLRSKKCLSCAYCDESLDETKALKRFFHFDEFRFYNGIPLQKEAVKAVIENKSILVIFPTGGGKSITFQLPALMAGVNEKGLTVVISPLQSLMKDQTDNLEKQYNITEAVTINGSLDPIERAKAFERVENGQASILYISPESLRSKSIEILLLKRNVVRFVIDEAHCFSSWGQDFRVDYLYIGKFIRKLQIKKNRQNTIPISCFTATAKKKVIEDIKDYFKEKLSLNLELFKANVARENLKYHILSVEDDAQKYKKLRQLISDSNCLTIVYTLYTGETENIAARLTKDGYPAKPYHGKMDMQVRSANQDAFMNGEVMIIVATAAFGMGVDKKDVGMVIHYNISDSLENYLQEAGRAGRDENINADCYVLYNDEDLNKHFEMLNRTRMSQKEIQQIWKGLKELTKTRDLISQSALEIAKTSGWDDTKYDAETRVKTAINALEQAKFIERKQNDSSIYADSILIKSREEALSIIDNSEIYDNESRQYAVRIINCLIEAKIKGRGNGETRVDYIADRLGINKKDVIRVIRIFREDKILADDKDITAYIRNNDNKNHSRKILFIFKKIETFILSYLDDCEKTYNIKEINEILENKYPNTSIDQLVTIMNFYSIKRIIKRTPEYNINYVTIKPEFPIIKIQEDSNKRFDIAIYIIDYLFSKIANELDKKETDTFKVYFSIFELKKGYIPNMFDSKIMNEDIEDALYYLNKIGALKIEDGYLVYYNAMKILRLEKDNLKYYNNEHYMQLDEYYKNKRQQIHIVGEYANLILHNYKKAFAFVNDYFEIDYNIFLNKYFKERNNEINNSITKEKFNKLFGELSNTQLDVIKDHNSKYIVVAAGPGSGKTKLLTHKLSSLFMMEDVKHEQMIMLTFSRMAATEFIKRMKILVGSVVHYIQIMTFHSYCFDLLGKVGTLEKSDDIIKQAIEGIKERKVNMFKLTKTVLVIDEAQDMSKQEYLLVKTLMKENDNLRIIAVGDDDQNIFEWRGSSSKYFESFLKEKDAKKYELVENYRSNANIVEFSNQYAKQISYRFKTIPIKPMIKENGKISICKLLSENIAIPVVNMIQNIKPAGTTCIIVRTNEEAINIVRLLNKRGITARKIKNNDEFNLYNLEEIRYFIDSINKDDNYVINAEIWQQAKSNLNKKYIESDNLLSTNNLIKEFEEINKTIKYKNDFKEFVNESNLEDFISAKKGSVLVSTIHQTKGREFDNVFLAFSQFLDLNDERKREIYVAITRAKQNLHILYNGKFLDAINVENMKRSIDNNDYPMPEEICLQLSHNDVALGLFAFRKDEINSLVSGKEIKINEIGCFIDKIQVVKFSSKFCMQIDKLMAKGYFPIKAVVRHIVFWKNKDKEGEEIKIILPDVVFSKSLPSHYERLLTAHQEELLALECR